MQLLFRSAILLSGLISIVAAAPPVPGRTVRVEVNPHRGQRLLRQPDVHRNAIAPSNSMVEVATEVATQWIREPRAIRLGELNASAWKADADNMLKMTLDVPGGGNVQVFGYPIQQDQYVSGSVSASGAWESGNVAKLCGLWSTLASTIATAKGNFMDVGGNIGTFTLPIAACIAGKGEVFTVEGMPSIASHLKAGIVENGLQNVALFPYAVGSELPANEVIMALNPVNKGGSAVIGSKDWSITGIKDGHGVDNFSTSLTTLDAMLLREPGMQRLLAMKMDIEGSEGRALQGAKELLAKYPPCTLMIELSPEWLQRNGTPLKEVVPKLTEAGYDTSEIQMNTIGTYTLQQKDMPRCLARFEAALNQQ